MIDNAKIKFLIGNEPALLTVQETKFLVETLQDKTVISYERILTEILKESPDNLTNNVPPNSTMYILYTSGSTGEPKGVPIQHRSVSNFIMYPYQ